MNTRTLDRIVYLMQTADDRTIMGIIDHISPVAAHMKRKYCERSATYGPLKGFAVLYAEMDDMHRQALADYLTVPTEYFTVAS